MPSALFLPILLRLAGPIAFVIAAMTAGAMNRSFVIIPLLALAASLTTILIRVVSPFPALDLQTALNPDAPPQKSSPFRGVGRRLIIGLFGYAFAYGFAAVIAAVFQSTEFERQLSSGDVGYLLIPGIIAFFGALLGARLGVNQMAGMMDQMQDMFSQMQARANPQGEDETFTFEGEIIDPDEPKS